MKRILTIVFCFLLSFPVFSQSNEKPDVIIKLNGDELKGKVLEMGADEIKFSYTGEKLPYTIKKSEILTITFASGRTEVITKPGQGAGAVSDAGIPTGGNTPTSAVASADHRNRIAILPFSVIRDGQPTADQLGEKAQFECYSFLSKNAGLNTIVEPRTSNAMLIKAGVTKDNIKGYTMDDLCHILGVEYVVDAVITVNKGQQTNYTNVTGSSTTKKDEEKNKKKQSVSGSAYTTTTQNYENTVVLNIYNDKGSSIYSQERESMLKSDDAYKNTLQYLLKRSPIYHRQ